MLQVAPAAHASIIESMDAFTAIGPLTTHPSAFTGSRGLLAALADLLKQSNGFAMWRGALVVLPSGQADGLPTIESYNDGAWKRSYDEDVHDTTFFALDVFGYPFGISGDHIVQLDPETGRLELISNTMRGLLERVEREPKMIGIAVFNNWLASGRTLDIQHRLAPKIPFILGGGTDREDFYAADIMQRAEFNAYIYEETKNLPEGTQMRFEITD